VEQRSRCADFPKRVMDPSKGRIATRLGQVAMPKKPTPPGFHYVRPKRWKMRQLPRGPGNGFIDENGYEWQKGPNHHFQNEIDPATGQPYTYEWDVQIGGGDYYNVSPAAGPQ
jgi:hypothetical protein